MINKAIASNQPDTTLGRIYLEAQQHIYLNDLNKAIGYLHKAEKIYLRHKEMKREQIEVFYNLGHHNHQLQLYQIALNYLIKAHNLQMEEKDYIGAGYSNCDIGNVFFAFNQFSVAESYYRNSLDLFSKQKDDYGMSVMNNNLGLCKMSIHRPDSAFVYFNQGYKLRLRLKERFAIDHSINYLATAYAALHEYDKAIVYFTRVIDDISSWADAPLIALQLKADAQFNMWELYHEQKNKYLANSYLDQALESYNHINDTAGTIKTLSAMADDEYNEKEYWDAIQHGEAAYLLADIKGLIRSTHKLSGFLTKVYLRTGNQTGAEKYLSLYTALSDSVMNQYYSSGLTQTHADLQTLYKDMENKALKVKEKLTYRFLIVIGLLFLIAVTLYFYALYTKRTSILNLKSLADATFEAIVIHDNGKILEVNNQFCVMSGYDRTEVIKKQIEELGFMEMNEDVRNSLNSKKQCNYETHLLSKDGNSADVEVVSKPLRYKNKLVRVVVMRDVTERKRYINELISSNQQNKELIATKDKLFSIIAHDLKNPFNAIRGFSELMIKDFDTFSKEEQLEMITMISDSSKYAYDLLENLLEWALVQTGSLQFNPHKLQLIEQVKPIIALAHSTAQAKQIEVKLDIANDCYVFADPRMLRTIMLNLISNAIKFTPHQGLIRVEATDIDHATQIAVIDSGIGIESAKLQSIFDVDNKKSSRGTDNEPGTGLGLVLCRDLVSKHNGKIEVSSTNGKGTIFTITLPYQA